MRRKAIVLVAMLVGVTGWMQLAPTRLASAADTALWRLGMVNNSAAEFRDFTAANPENVTVPADWATRTTWNTTVSKGLKRSVNPAMKISYNLATVPAHGVNLKFKLLDSYEGGPEMAVFSNSSPLVGLIQLWGTSGTDSAYKWQKTYQLFIPKEFLQVGANTLTLQASMPYYYQPSVDPNIWWTWDYLQLDALGAPAAEPIHGKMTHFGTTMNKNKTFVIDGQNVAFAETLSKWMGIAYSGNTMRAPFWQNTDHLQPARKELLEMYRDLNLTVVADHATSNMSGGFNADNTLTAAGKAKIDKFFSDYGPLMQYYEIENEPTGFGGNKFQEIEMAKYINSIKPAWIKTTAPGYSYGTGGTPAGFDRDPAQRREIEAHAQATNGHSYGGSYSSDGGGGSFTAGLATTNGVADGWTKEFVNTETGTNNWHSEANNGFGMGSSQTNASAFDRIMRAHAAVVDRTVQHAAIFEEVLELPWGTYPTGGVENFGLFAVPCNGACNWSANSMQASPGVGGQDPRLKTYRRLSLAYATHGTPLNYSYLNGSAVAGKKVYFRPVDTNGIPALPGNGHKSDKVLLNFVNFEPTAQTMNVRVNLPRAGAWTGEMFDAGTTLASARSTVSLNATPTADVAVTLGPGESVQYILTPPAGLGTGLSAQYFDNMDLTNPKLTRIDPTINFAWAGAPDPTVGADSFSVRWTGKVEPATTGTYTFSTKTDDGVRLWVNGQLLIDKWVDQSATEYNATINLTAGVKYDMKMEYFENRYGASAELRWAGPGVTKQIIPQGRLYPS